MNTRDRALLEKLGIIITDLEYRQADVDIHMLNESLKNPDHIAHTEIAIHGEFTIDESRFRPMCRLIELVDMVCESKNPMVQEQFQHLITLVNLTK